MTKKLTFKIKGKGKAGDSGWAVGESIYVRYYSDASSDTKDEKIIETEEWDLMSELQSAWDSGRLV